MSHYGTGLAGWRTPLLWRLGPLSAGGQVQQVVEFRYWRLLLLSGDHFPIRQHRRMMDSSAPIGPGNLSDGDLTLKLAAFAPHPAHKVPTYFFRMVHAATDEELGGINLRVGSTRHIELFAGHVGYTVHPPHRLLMPLAGRLGLDPLRITCDPENLASRRCLDLAGAQFVEVVSVPEDCAIHRSGHRWTCRYTIG